MKGNYFSSLFFLDSFSSVLSSSNVVVLSPKNGTFAARFVESGAAVRIGDLETLLMGIRDVFCIICNTIMTANIVVDFANRPYPVLWILHEWWDDEMIKENLKIRNYQGLTLDTVKQALSLATRVICVCDSQRQLYNPSAPSEVVFVGVPDPIARLRVNSTDILPTASVQDVIPMLKEKEGGTFTFLCLGIICPRKNQLWTVKMFKKWAQDKPNVKLQVVGARYTRVYEMEYLEEVKNEIGDDTRIELYDVSDDVDKFYRTADCLILTSLNEVTPMVITESLAWGIPVISTNIAGIKEMFTNGIEGYHFDPDDEESCIQAMESIYSDDFLRNEMSYNARQRYEEYFDLNIQVDHFRQLVTKVAPPVILIDMDGVLVNWDKAFLEEWNDRAPLDRKKSYYIEKCMPDSCYEPEAEIIFHQPGFFLKIEWMEGAKEALLEMEEAGFQIYIVTSPIRTSRYCAQEKIDFIRIHLGEHWVTRLVLCQDKVSFCCFLSF
jgi:glycosyltransferase involved in cell wall biosynthesis/5'(3')-deoxyribonucleotidase